MRDLPEEPIKCKYLVVQNNHVNSNQIEKIINEINVLTLPKEKSGNFLHKPGGPVKGSKEKTEKEIALLCSRLLEDFYSNIAKKSLIVLPQYIHWFACNTPVTSVLQGYGRPRCGMVALSMAGKILSQCNPSVKEYTDTDFLKVAKNFKYSNVGEMLSAHNLAKLASYMFNCTSVVISETLLKSYRIIIQHLAKGYPVLVPYDNDRNYEPRLGKGHHAHWAILTGVVFATQRNICVSKTSRMHKIGGINFTDSFDELMKYVDEDIIISSVHVFAKQGKSAKPLLWSYSKLSSSNANLVERSPDKDWNVHIVPEGDIIENLCSKSVLLYPNNEQVNF